MTKSPRRSNDGVRKLTSDKRREGGAKRRAVPFHKRRVSEKTFQWVDVTEMGVRQRLAETAKRRSRIILHLLSPSHPSITLLPQQETLTPSILLFSGANQ